MLYQIKSQISSLCKRELPFVCPRKANLCGTRKEQKKRNSLKAVLWKCLHPPGFPEWIPTQETDEGCLELLDLQFCGLCLPPLLKHKASKGIYVHRSCSLTTSFQTSPPSAGRNIPAGSGVLPGFFQAVPLTPGDAEDPRVPSASRSVPHLCAGAGFLCWGERPPLPTEFPEGSSRAGELQKDVLSWQGVLRVCCKEKKQGEIPPFR